MRSPHRPLPLLACLLCASAITASCVARNADESAAMTPSITYLHLLRHTPFFTALDSTQLRWVIDHSREWEVHTGATLSSSHPSDADSGYWILLDGGWQLQYQGQALRSGHSDPGKWFNREQLHGDDYALVASEHSYVMQISTQDMDAMLAKGFAFQPHLDAGIALYRGLRQPHPTHQP